MQKYLHVMLPSISCNYTTRKAACGFVIRSPYLCCHFRPSLETSLLHILSEVACHLSSWQTKKTCLSHHPAPRLLSSSHICSQSCLTE